MKTKLLLVFAVLAAAISFEVIQPLKKTKRSHNKELGELKENRSVALDALQFTTAAAAFPNKDIPANAYASAIQWYQRNNNNASRTSSIYNSWISMGPTNMGGRTIAMAMDPTDTAVIWLGSASGGLWKSTTGGIGANAWTYVPLGFPVLGVSSIAINPLNHNEMYMGTGEVYSDSSYSQGIVALRPTRGSYGMGLFKSTDGGNTWTQSINWTYQQNRGIWSIVINPLKPTEVYAGTTEGVYKSSDAGATWTKVLSIAMCMDLQIHKIDTNILLCGVGNYGSTIHGVYRTSNSGTTWSLVTSGLPPANNTGRITFAAYENNNDTMYAHICDVYNTVGIYMSGNKGQTWVLTTSQDISTYQGWYSKGLVIQAGNPNYLLIGGVDIFESTDGGYNFSDLLNFSSNFHTDVHDIFLNPKDQNKVYVLTDGGLYRSNNFGGSFYDCNGGYNTTQSYIGSISSTDTTVLLSGLQDNNTIKYFGNQTWYGVVGGDGCYNAIDHTNDNIQYGAYQYLNVYSCSDRGLFNAYYQILNYPSNANTPNYAGFLAPYILCYSNTQYIYACGQGLQLSTDAGNTWNFMGNNPVNSGAYIMAIAASFTNTDSIYFATAPDSTHTLKVFSSANQGTTLKDISAGLPNRYPRRIAVNPSNSQEVYIVFSGFGGKHIFKSINGGGSWTDISTNLPDMPFECIVVDPKYTNFLYAGCDFGAFYSPDKGTTWFTYDLGFPDATMVFDLVVSPSDRYLYAFTHGRGIFKHSLSDIFEGSNNITATVPTVKIFPNPTSDEVHINIDAASGKYFVYIYDMQGKQVKADEFEGASTVIPVNDLSHGVYIVAISKNGGTYQYQKLIKD